MLVKPGKALPEQISKQIFNVKDYTYLNISMGRCELSASHTHKEDALPVITPPIVFVASNWNATCLFTALPRSMHVTMLTSYFVLFFLSF